MLEAAWADDTADRFCAVTGGGAMSTPVFSGPASGVGSRRARALAVALVVALVACGRDAPSEPSTAQRYGSLLALQETFRDFSMARTADEVRRAYDALFPDAYRARILAGPDPHAVTSLYEAAAFAAFYTLDPRYVEQMHAALAVLEHHGADQEEQHHSVRDAMVKARMFDAARTFRASRPKIDLEAIPELREAPGVVGARRTVLRAGADANVVTREPAVLPQGGHVVIVFHPNCHFSANAVAAIEQDAQLADVLSTQALWLAPQEGTPSFERLRAWSGEHPRLRAAVVDQWRAWKMIDTWATPTFYFMTGETVVAKVEGWPKEGRRAEILAGMQKIGLDAAARVRELAPPRP